MDSLKKALGRPLFNIEILRPGELLAELENRRSAVTLEETIQWMKEINPKIKIISASFDDIN
jgi:hypothetical protein